MESVCDIVLVSSTVGFKANLCDFTNYSGAYTQYQSILNILMLQYSNFYWTRDQLLDTRRADEIMHVKSRAAIVPVCSLLYPVYGVCLIIMAIF